MGTSSGSTTERAAAMDPRIGDRAVELLRELEERKTDEPEVAPLGSRFIARCIDLAFAAVLVLALVLVVGMINLIRHHGQDPVPVDDPTRTDYVVMLVSLAVAVLIVEMVPSIWWRQSPGKKLLGLRVMRSESGETPGLKRLFLRTLLWTAALTLAGGAPLGPLWGWAFVGALALAWASTVADPNRRAPHDRLLATRVMRPR